ncbi:MAG: phage terminase large subunit [Novosphingobium sp.]|nr:phage terminase large subunit [Novosphingobium sp.]
MIPEYMQHFHRKKVTYREFDALTRLHFAVFVQRVFAELNPGVSYLDNFHIHVINEALEDLRRGDERRLAVAMPPRSLKSIIISVAWVAWLLGHDPGQKIICVSYSQELADKLASDCRQVMQSDWYQRLFPKTRLRQGRQSLANFETTAGGGRFSTSTGGTLTGFGAEWIILDDPMKPSEALSDTERNTANNWIQHTLFTRLNDKRTGRIVLVMQRLHLDDAIGNLEEKAPGTFRLLSFPAIALEDEVHDYATPFGRLRHLRKEGEALHPEREPLEVLEEQRRLLGSMYFSAQYLQAPVPVEGNLVKRAWFRDYQPFEIEHPDRIIQSWDTASKAGQVNDYSVCTTWAAKGDRYYLLDVHRERLEFPALKYRVVDQADRFKADLVLIEDKGSGEGLLQVLRAEGFGKCRPVLPERDKASRFVTASAMIEEGRVYLPHSAAWLDVYLDELCGFPGMRHDDQVDSTSQALNFLLEEGNPGGIFHYYRQEHEKREAWHKDRTVKMRAPRGVSHFYGIDGTCYPVGADRILWLTEQDAAGAMAAGFVRLPPDR